MPNPTKESQRKNDDYSEFREIVETIKKLGVLLAVVGFYLYLFLKFLAKLIGFIVFVVSVHAFDAACVPILLLLAGSEGIFRAFGAFKHGGGWRFSRGVVPAYEAGLMKIYGNGAQKFPIFGSLFTNTAVIGMTWFLDEDNQPTQHGSNTVLNPLETFKNVLSLSFSVKGIGFVQFCGALLDFFVVPFAILLRLLGFRWTSSQGGKKKHVDLLFYIILILINIIYY